jgi:hypothetical protein
MIHPVTEHLTCYQGATFTHTFTHRVNGSLVNLTGYSARMQARTRVRGMVGSAAFTLTSTSGLTLGGAAGTVAVSISAAVTEILTPGLYRYDVTLTTGSTVVRAFEGRFTVAPAITAED